MLKALATFAHQHLQDQCEVYVDLPYREHERSMGGAVPAHLLTTSQRPDLLVANRSARVLAVVELTVPSEHNAQDAKIRKTVKYGDLVRDARAEGWQVTFFTLEICSRGIIPVQNLSIGMKRLKDVGLLSFSRADCQELISKCAQTALSASYWIYCSRSSTHIPDQQPLLS